MYGFGISVLLPIFPTFIESIINSEAYVGYFYSAMSISMIIAGLVSSVFFRKFSRVKILYFVLVVAALATMYFVFVNQFYQLFPLQFVRVFAVLFISMSLALMVHDFTSAKALGKTEGVYFLFTNIGWFLGPFVGGVIARYAGFEPVFVLSGVLLLCSLIYIIHQHLIKKHPSLALPHAKPKKDGDENKFKKYLSNKNRIGAYLVSMVLISWVSFKAVVIPLFVLKMGYGSDTAGLILSLSILPYMLFEVPVGEWADKNGFKKPIITGFFILAFFAMAVAVSPIFYLDALFIILGNVGSAMIEPLHDVYFFKNVKNSEEDDMYGIFVTADPLAKFVAPAIISTSLIFLPFQYVFVVFGCLFLVAGFGSFLIKDQKHG